MPALFTLKKKKKKGHKTMIEVLNTTAVTVESGQVVPFALTAVKGGCAERHRAGSAQITLTKPGRYLVTYSGNVAVPTGGTAGEIDFAIARGNEAIPGTTMRATPAAVEQYFNTSTQTYVDVYPCCCETITVKNIGAIVALVDNPNLTAVRVCG